MEDSEKLTALKKAYAETILNTAKEAAARIMVSERKAQRSQQELCMAKEEALRILVRLKQMMDSKIDEAKVISLSQQKKIEELEAQLEEAEDIVRELRDELREVQNALEKMTRKQLQSLDGKDLKGDTGSEVEAAKDNKLSSTPLILPPVGSRPEPVPASDLKNLTFNKRNEGNKCYGANNPYMENCYVGNRDFASIVTRSKEPELYRNGCTQRIRAFESSLLEGKLPLSEEVDGVMSETTTREEEEGGERMYMITTAKDDNVCRIENLDEAKEIRQTDGSCYPVPVIKSFRRKRKRAARYNNKDNPSRQHLDQVMETHQASDLSLSKTCSCAIRNNVQPGENPSNINANESQKDPEFPSTPKLPSDATEMSKQSECVEVAENDVEFVKACSVRNTLNNDKMLIDKSVLARQESGSPEISEVQSTRDLETADLSVVKLDLKVSDTIDVILGQPVKDKFLKTFQRKRKKENLSHGDGNYSLDKSTLERSTEETQSAPLELQQSTLITESSRDSRQVAQVARQLISLSEKKWWQ